MHLHIEPDIGIPFPEGDVQLKDFVEKAQAACASAELLGLELDDEPDEKTLNTAEQAVYDLAEAPEKANKKLTKATHTPAVYRQVNGILNEYSLRVVDNAMQIRLLVTNKLILESENEDAKIRLRALELLGKITDVGLFTEKSEVTITHRSSEDLVNSIRAKLQNLMRPKNTEEAVVVDGEIVDLDAELGINTPENEEKEGENSAN